MTLKWAAAVAATAGMPASVHAFFRATAVAPAIGYGKDPPLTEPVRGVWAITLTGAQIDSARRLADRLLPGDLSAELPTPAASVLGLEDFFAEWLSAPYPDQQNDRASILPLLDALAVPGADLDTVRRTRGLAPAAERFRVLAAAAYYTTPVGMTAMGFVGNEAQERFEGPPADTIARLEAAYTALDDLE